MRVIGALDAAGWQAWGVWGTALIYAAIGFVIWQQVREARRLRQTQVDLQRAESRPFIVVDFDVLRLRKFIYLTITNHGRTIARNVRLRPEPEFSSSLEEKHQALSNVRLLTDGLPVLAPGKTIPILFDSFLERGDRPDAYTVQLTYQGPEDETYRESVLLDLGVYRNLLYIDRKDIHDMSERLEEISRTLSRWTSTSGGLKVQTGDDEGPDHDE